jgi:hypothetical protein
MTIAEPVEPVATTDGALSAYLGLSAELLQTITYVPDVRAALPRLMQLDGGDGTLSGGALGVRRCRARTGYGLCARILDYAIGARIH